MHFMIYKYSESKHPYNSKQHTYVHFYNSHFPQIVKCTNTYLMLRFRCSEVSPPLACIWDWAGIVSSIIFIAELHIYAVGCIFYSHFFILEYVSSRILFSNGGLPISSVYLWKGISSQHCTMHARKRSWILIWILGLRMLSLLIYLYKIYTCQSIFGITIIPYSNRTNPWLVITIYCKHKTKILWLWYTTVRKIKYKIQGGSSLLTQMEYHMHLSI